MSICLPFLAAEAFESLIKRGSTPVREIIVCKGKLRQRPDSVICARLSHAVFRCLQVVASENFRGALALRAFTKLAGRFNSSISAEIAVIKHALDVRLSKASTLFVCGRRWAGIRLFTLKSLSLGIWYFCAMWLLQSGACSQVLTRP